MGAGFDPRNPYRQVVRGSLRSAVVRVMRLTCAQVRKLESDNAAYDVPCQMTALACDVRRRDYSEFARLVYHMGISASHDTFQRATVGDAMRAALSKGPLSSEQLARTLNVRRTSIGTIISAARARYGLNIIVIRKAKNKVFYAMETVALNADN